MDNQTLESNKKVTSSVQDVSEEKPAFGSRFLKDNADVWTQNAWDHVPPPTDQAETISKSLSKQRSAPVPSEEKLKYNEKPARHWDNFYKSNANNFFRNRKWLHNEFPELVTLTAAEAGPAIIMEVGCGAGNSVFPLLSSNQNPQLRLHAYDYSSHAVKLVQTDPLYTSPPVGSISASVWDLTSSEGPPADIIPGTVNIVILVFVFSALHPEEWGRAVKNIHKILKPGGLVLFRDYGRYDMTQLRFKGGRLLDENFYIRGDKTRVYFFELDELALLFTGSRNSSSQQVTDTTTTEYDEDPQRNNPQPSGEDLDRSSTEEAQAQGALGDQQHNPSAELPSPSAAGTPATSISPSSQTSTSLSFSSHVNRAELTPLSDGQEETNETTTDAATVTETPSAQTSTSSSAVHPILLSPLADCSLHPLFSVEKLGVDRRLIVNRKRQIKMYRVWMQGKFRKL